MSWTGERGLASKHLMDDERLPQSRKAVLRSFDVRSTKTYQIPPCQWSIKALGTISHNWWAKYKQANWAKLHLCSDRRMSFRPIPNLSSLQTPGSPEQREDLPSHHPGTALNALVGKSRRHKLAWETCLMKTVTFDVWPSLFWEIDFTPKPCELVAEVLPQSWSCKFEGNIVRTFRKLPPV